MNDKDLRRVSWPAEAAADRWRNQHRSRRRPTPCRRPVTDAVPHYSSTPLHPDAKCRQSRAQTDRRRPPVTSRGRGGAAWLAAEAADAIECRRDVRRTQTAAWHWSRDDRMRMKMTSYYAAAAGVSWLPGTASAAAVADDVAASATRADLPPSHPQRHLAA